jgi:hypothetical protein
MNMMEIVNHAKSVLGDEFKFCAGNAYTVSRAAAGLAFAAIATPGQISASRCQTGENMPFSTAQTFWNAYSIRI